MKRDDDRRRAGEFAKRIVQRRQELGWTQADVTRRLRPLLPDTIKLDRTSMSRYEAGQNIPRSEVLKALATLFEVGIDDLLPLTPTHSDKLSLSAEGDVTRLTLDLELPHEVAARIYSIIAEHRKAERERNPVEKKES